MANDNDAKAKARELRKEVNADPRSNAAILRDVRDQLELTLKKVKTALKDTEGPYYSDYRSSSFAAAKRSAMDLKQELTKLTQSSRYRYGRDRRDGSM